MEYENGLINGSIDQYWGLFYSQTRKLQLHVQSRLFPTKIPIDLTCQNMSGKVQTD